MIAPLLRDWTPEERSIGQKPGIIPTKPAHVAARPARTQSADPEAT
jgi:hypothetical protein